jgi:hypothetical protein
MVAELVSTSSSEPVSTGIIVSAVSTADLKQTNNLSKQNARREVWAPPSCLGRALLGRVLGIGWRILLGHFRPIFGANFRVKTANKSSAPPYPAAQFTRIEERYMQVGGAGSLKKVRRRCSKMAPF